MNDAGRRIIYVWNYREWGGAQIYFLLLMKETKKSYDVGALIPSDSEPRILEYLDALDISYDFLPPAPAMTNPRGMLGKISRRLALLKSENNLVRHLTASADLSGSIVHADLGFWQSFLPLFRLSRKTHVFMTVHTGLPRMRGIRGLIWTVKGRMLSRLPTFHLIASNNDAKEGVRPYLAAEKFEQIEVTYSGFGEEEISRVLENHPGKEAVLDQYEIPKNLPVLITVGQFILRKGCWVLLDSLLRLKREGGEFVFLWLATSAPDDAAMGRIESYGLGESFRLMTAEDIGQTREQLLTLLSVADLFVLASLEEGLPIALVEAMALGLPCVATVVNAIPEAIEDGINGRLVPPNDAAALGDAIRTLLDDPHQREKLGVAAKESAYTNFNARSAAVRTVKLYNAVWKTEV